MKTLNEINNMNKKLLIIHHSSVSRETQPAQFYAINRYHREKWGMKSSLGYYHGYTHYMGTNGVITQTRSLDEEGIHTKGHNKSGNIGICLAGNFSMELPNDKQIESLKKFIADNINYEIMFHNELGTTTCPGTLFTRDYLDKVVLGKKPKLLKADKEKQELITRYNSLLSRLKELLLSFMNRV